jgi:hypothetical protein
MEIKSKHDTVVELANKLFVYTDTRQWSKLIREVFTDEINSIWNHLAQDLQNR